MPDNISCNIKKDGFIAILFLIFLEFYNRQGRMWYNGTRKLKEKRGKVMGEHVERIERELKYKGKILEIYADTMRNPDGKTTTWDFVHHNGAAAVVPVTEKGTILMVEQSRPALGRYTLEIPAGALDEPDEPGIVCAKRELEEETGFRSEDIEWLITVHTTVAFCDEKIPIFVARNLIPSKQHLDEDEFIDVRECTVEELKQQIFAGKIEDSKTISAILAFDAKYNRA